MPVNGELNYEFKVWAVQEARRQVRAKFPSLAEGTAGWWRAIENRMRRLTP